MKPFQPYPRLEEKHLPLFRKKGGRYFVSQSYERGKTRVLGNEKMPLVFTLYKDTYQAIVHKDAVKDDRYAAFIDMDKPAHLATVKAMLQPDARYEVFVSMVWNNEDTNRYIKQQYDRHVERYLNSQTSWRIPKAETVHVELKIIFGQPFLLITWRNNTLQVPFEDIEKA